MKKIYFILLFSLCSICLCAQAKLGVYAGVSSMTVKTEYRSNQIDNGWEYNIPLGGQVGLDLKIPVVAGLYFKPGIYGWYMNDYCKKESSKEGTVSLLDKVQGYHITYKDYHYRNVWRNSEQTDAITLIVPLTIGYSLPVGSKANLSLGVNGFGALGLMSLGTKDSEAIYTTTPSSSYNKTTHDKQTADGYKDIPLKNRLSYGIGGEAEFAVGSFFTRYRLLYPITKSKTEYTLLHDISFGIYF